MTRKKICPPVPSLLAPLWLLAAAVLPACQGAEAAYVSISGAPAEATRLRLQVALEGKDLDPALEVFRTAGDRARVPLPLPEGASGIVTVSVEAMEQGRCTLATGSATAFLRAGETIEVAVPLARLRHALSVVKLGTGDGAVTGAPAGIDCGPQCDVELPACTPLTLSVAADARSTFSGWAGACTGAGPCALVLSGATSVVAAFDSKPVALSIGRGGDGTGSVVSDPGGIDCGARCRAEFPAGAQVRLRAVPDGGSYFTGWTEGPCAGTDPCMVRLDEERQVTAGFAILRRSLTIWKEGTGAGVVSSTPAGLLCGGTCSYDFPTGTSVQLTAAPDATSEFAGWSGACSGTGGCTVATRGLGLVRARFTRKRYPIEVVVTGRGSIATLGPGIACTTGQMGTCSMEVDAGTALTLQGTATAPYRFSSLKTTSGSLCSPVPLSPQRCQVTVDEPTKVTGTFLFGK